MYSAMREVYQKEDDGYFVSIADACVVPSDQEISSRWPGMSQEDVEGIYEEYRNESERLAELGLDDVYDRIQQLASESNIFL